MNRKIYKDVINTYFKEIKMSLEQIKEFGERLAVMKNPRARRGFVDSFHAGLVQGDIYDLDAETIEESSKLEAKYGFEPHAKKLLGHPHYQTTSKELDQFHQPEALNLARKFETANDTVSGVGPVRFGMCLGDLAEAEDISGFKRLGDAYVDWETRMQPDKPQEEIKQNAIRNLKFACKVADYGAFPAAMDKEETLPIGKTQSFFQKHYSVN